MTRGFPESLLDPAAYPHPVENPTLIETHISWVVLTGAWAYKVKKPLALPFLDFSTLDRRRYFCAEELRLNGRFTPGLYDSVVEIRGTPERPTLSGTGPGFEVAVKMRQFDGRLLWDRLLPDGGVTPDLVERLAHSVSRIHESAPVAAADAPYGTPDTFKTSVATTEKTLRDQPLGFADRHALDQAAAFIADQTRRLSDDLLRRRAGGRVREVHGDLHLRNIALLSREDPRIVVFDGIEFDPNLRWIDVMNDVAFLWMDFTQHRREDLGWRFLSDYLDRTGDHAGLRVLRLFAANRALVRAMVAHLETPARATSRENASRLLEQAAAYAAPPRPRLFITHGVSGSGKTTGAGELVMKVGAIRIRSDVERRRMFGDAPPETMYSTEANRRTYDRLAELAGRLLEDGFSVVVDAAFLRRSHRDRFRALAESDGVPFGIAAFTADPAELRRRVAARQSAGHDASQADVRVLEDQLKRVEPLDADEAADVVTNGRP